MKKTRWPKNTKSGVLFPISKDHMKACLGNLFQSIATFQRLTFKSRYQLDTIQVAKKSLKVENIDHIMDDLSGYIFNIFLKFDQNYQNDSIIQVLSDSDCV